MVKSATVSSILSLRSRSPMLCFSPCWHYFKLEANLSRIQILPGCSLLRLAATSLLIPVSIERRLYKMPLKFKRLPTGICC